MNPLQVISVAVLRAILKTRGLFQSSSAPPLVRGEHGSPDSLLLTLLEHASDFVTVLNADGTIVFESPAVIRLLGYHQKDIVGRNVFDFIHDDDFQRVFKQFKTGLKTPGFTTNLQCRFRHQNGSWRVLDVTGTNLLHDPAVRGIVVNSRDITEQEKAQKEKTLLSYALQSITEAVVITDLDETLLFVNDAMLKTYGYERKEILGQNNQILRSRRSQSGLGQVIYKATLTGHWSGELIHRRKDGTDFPVQLSTGVIRDEEGNAVALIGVVRDITERKKTEQDLNKTLSLLTATLESTADGILVVDNDGHILSFNKQFAGMWRIPPDILGSGNDESALQFVVSQLKDPDAFLSKVKELYSRPDAESFDTIEFNDGRFFERFSKPQRIGGASVGRVWSFRDVTERRQAEAARLQSEHQFRSLFEESKDAVYISTPEGRFVDVNQACIALFGYASKEEFLEIDITKDLFVDPESRIRYAQILERQGFVKDYLLALKRRDGSAVVVLETGSVVHDEKGQVAAYRGILHDVTHQNRIEKALRENEQRLRDIVEHSSNLFYSHTPGNVLTYVSPQTRQFLDCDPEEALVKWTDFVTENAVNAEGLERTMKAIETGRKQPSYKLELEGMKGRRIWVEVSEAPVVRDGKTVAMVGALTDITERKRAEEQLRKSEARYREFFEDDLTGDFISTPSGKILECNIAFARIFGYPSIEKVLKTNAVSFHANSEARQRFLQLLRERKKLENYEMTGRRIDGKAVHLIENVFGKFNEQGELVELKGYLFDITERKRLEEELRQSQKMESIGTLAGGIAHDFNNILSIIMVSASRVEREKQNREEHQRSIETIIKAVERGSGLTRQLLTFARKTEVSFEPLNVNEVIGELVKLLKETFPKTIILSTDFLESVPLISADRSQLNQAILNLCVNARDAMPQGGVIDIKTRIADRSQIRELKDHVPSSHYVLITVADTGPGMDRSTKDRIFEPFFTTKERGQGTGLGLAVVYGVVKSHSGMIHVESNPGAGTSFQLFFPLVGIQSPRETITEDEPDNAYDGAETVFLAEDEDAVRGGVVETLTAHGYRVITAADGEEALRIFEEQKKAIQVVVMDLGMPKINGLEVIDLILKRDSKVLIIVASGYFDPKVRERLQRLGIRHFIQKPYLPKTLMKSIRNLISGSS